MEGVCTPMARPGGDLISSPASSFDPEPLSVGPARPARVALKANQVGSVMLYGVPIVSLVIDGIERLCLAQISNTLLKSYSYNEIHNRRVALGITCVQCTPVQLEILRRAGAMPISSRRCGMITKREAERLCKSFLGENSPPKLPDNFAFDVSHECAWGSRGNFIPARYNSSRAKCIKCAYCNMYFSPNKFIFHSHRTPEAKYTQPDAANFNSWRRHLKLSQRGPPQELAYAWEDVKAMFNGGSRKRALPSSSSSSSSSYSHKGLGHLLAPGTVPKISGFNRGLELGPRLELELDAEAGVGGVGVGPGGVVGPHLGKTVRSFPVIPVPSKGFGMLHKFPSAASLFPGPYAFPAAAFGICQKKDDGGGGNGGGGGDPLLGADKLSGAGLSGLLWPGRKDAFYPPLCMFWPSRQAAYLHPPPAVTMATLADSPAGGRPGFPGPGEVTAPPRDGLYDTDGLSGLLSQRHRLEAAGGDGDRERDRDRPAGGLGPGKPGYLSAFRPVLKDHPLLLPASLPPSLPSSDLESGDSAGEQEVDVGESCEATRPDRGCQERGEASDSPSGPRSLTPSSSDVNRHRNEIKQSLVSPQIDGDSSSDTKQGECTLDEPKRLAVGFWTEGEGDKVHDSPTPHPMKTDLDNMEKEELQKVLLEQIDLRRRLEQQFQALRGANPFTVVNNFHHQMKRELSYREEVTQLQMIPYTAGLGRKEKINSQLNKS